MDIKPGITITKNKTTIDHGALCDAFNMMLSEDGKHMEYERGIISQISLNSSMYDIVGCIPTSDKLVLFCNKISSTFNISNLDSPVEEQGDYMVTSNGIVNLESWSIIKEDKESNSLAQPFSLNKQDNIIAVVNDRGSGANLEIKVTDWVWRGGIVKGVHCYNGNNELIVAFTELTTLNTKNKESYVPLKIINLDTGNNIIEYNDDTKYTINPNIPIVNMNLLNVNNSGSLYKGIYYYFVRFRDDFENCTNWKQVGHPISIHECNNKLVTKVLVEPEGSDSGNYAFNYEILNDDTDTCNKELVLKFSHIPYENTAYYPYIEIAYIVQAETFTKAYYINQYKIEIGSLEAIIVNHNKLGEEYDLDKLTNPTLGIYDVVGIGEHDSKLYIGNYREKKDDIDPANNSDITVGYRYEDFLLNTENITNSFVRDGFTIYTNQVCFAGEKVQNGGTGDSRLSPLPYITYAGSTNDVFHIIGIPLSNFSTISKTIQLTASTETLNIPNANTNGYSTITVNCAKINDIVPQYIKDRGYLYFVSSTYKSGNTFTRSNSNTESGGFSYANNSTIISYSLNDLRIYIDENEEYKLGVLSSNSAIPKLYNSSAYYIWSFSYPITSWVETRSAPYSKLLLYMDEFLLKGTDSQGWSTSDILSRDGRMTHSVSNPAFWNPIIATQSYYPLGLSPTWQGTSRDGPSGKHYGTYEAPVNRMISGSYFSTDITLSDVYNDYDKYIPLYSSNQKSAMPGEVYRLNVVYHYKDGHKSRGVPITNNPNRTYNGYDMRQLIKDSACPDVQHLKPYLGDYPLYTVINNATASSLGYYRNETTGEEFFRIPNYNAIYSELRYDTLSRIILVIKNIKIPNDPNIVGISIAYDEVDTIVASTGVASKTDSFFKEVKYVDANINKRTRASDSRIITQNDIDSGNIFYYDNRIFLDKKTISAKLLVAETGFTINTEELASSSSLTMQYTARKTTRQSGYKNIFVPIKQVDYLGSNNVYDLRLGKEESIRIIPETDNSVVSASPVYAYLCNMKTDLYPPSTTRKLIDLGYIKIVTPGTTVNYGEEQYAYAYDTYLTRDSHLLYAYNGVEYDEDNGEFVDPINNATYDLSVLPWILFKYYKYSRMQMETRRFKEAPKIIYNASNKSYNTVVLPDASQNLFTTPLSMMSLNDIIVNNSYYEGLGSKEVYYHPYTFRESSIQSDESQKIDWKVFPISKYKIIPSNRGVITNIIEFNKQLLIHCENGLFNIDTANRLRLDNTDLQLAAIDIFDVPVRELFTSSNGYAGLQSPFGYCLSEKGYCFVDLKNRQIFHYTGDKLECISDYGLSERMRSTLVNISSDNLSDITKLSSIGYDRLNSRYIIKIPSNYSGDIDLGNVFVVSYDIRSNKWISRHGYNPVLMYNTSNRLFSVYKNTIYNVGLDHRVNRYEISGVNSYNTTHAWIDIVLNKYKDIEKVLQSISIEISSATSNSSTSVESDNIDNVNLQYLLNRIAVYSDKCSTGELIVNNLELNTLSNFLKEDNNSVTPLYVNGKIQISDFLDWSDFNYITYSSVESLYGSMIKANGFINDTYINKNKSFEDIGDIYGKYIVIRLGRYGNLTYNRSAKFIGINARCTPNNI